MIIKDMTDGMFSYTFILLHTSTQHNIKFDNVNKTLPHFKWPHWKKYFRQTKANVPSKEYLNVHEHVKGNTQCRNHAQQHFEQV